jgi:hypothetical protein
VREFDHFGDCFCTCALIIWTVPLHTQVEGLDFEETYAPVARLEAIRILLDYA